MNPAAAFNPLAATPGMSSIGAVAGFPQTGFPQTGGISQLGQPAYGGLQSQSGISPQQLQLASVLASQAAIPQLLGVPPIAAAFNNPVLHAVLQNPVLAAALQNQLTVALQQIAQQAGSQYGPQAGSPFGQQPGSPWGQQQQIGSPFGQGLPLAPQSWVGQNGILGGGQPFGQVHPLLAQLNARQFQSPGVSPWGY